MIAAMLPAPEPIRVLTVDDHPLMREGIAAVLGEQPDMAPVGEAADGWQGLQAFERLRPDVTLMDIQMPGMDGIEALRCFRGGGDGRVAFLTSGRTPVVAVTADAHDGDEQRYRDLGFDDYLPKPFRLSQLLAMLLRQLSPIAAPLPAADVPSAGAAPAAPAGPGAVLDPAALDKLRDLDPRGDSRLLERVMKAFETSVARLLPQLQEAHRLGDQAGIRHVVHTLKASSASIGALALSQQCAEIETRIRLGEADGMDARIEAVYAELENVLKALRPWTDGKA
jgi:CheY-like chemotaxis protein